MTTDSQVPSRATQAVAVIHGLGGHRLVMAPLCTRLRRTGYLVKNWGYASLVKNIKAHADQFRKTVEQLNADPAIDELHIVAHSMGCIISRVVLQACLPSKLKRIVMICPPNHGSRMASRCVPLLGWLSQPLVEIADSPVSFVNSLATTIDRRVEVGIIRAQYDFMVAAESTELPEAVDYVTLRSLHSSILFRQDTAVLVDRFLQAGLFGDSQTRGPL